MTDMTPGDRKDSDHGSGQRARHDAEGNRRDGGEGGGRGEPTGGPAQTYDARQCGPAPAHGTSDREPAPGDFPADATADDSSALRAPAPAAALSDNAAEWDAAFAALVARLTDGTAGSGTAGSGPTYGPDYVPAADQVAGAYGQSDHYEPPPPPPVPRMRPVTRWALCSLALGLGILLVPAVAGIRQGTGHDIAGVVLVLGGVATLVAQLGDRPPTDSDDGDDGAVV
ncbi:hypothetical protein [Frankia sp. Cj3]|uniref:hypothetical protein n=1 Tax=Frankia sp. Cj3 TaxID=2880976 RepID=UPI001EF5F309|nr:hypothetical protein [Frankia sp. Cj3]